MAKKIKNEALKNITDSCLRWIRSFILTVIQMVALITSGVVIFAGLTKILETGEVICGADRIEHLLVVFALSIACFAFIAMFWSMFSDNYHR